LPALVAKWRRHLDAVVGEAGYPGIRVASVQGGNVAVAQPVDSDLVDAGGCLFISDHLRSSVSEANVRVIRHRAIQQLRDCMGVAA